MNFGDTLILITKSEQWENICSNNRKNADKCEKSKKHFYGYFYGLRIGYKIKKNKKNAFSNVQNIFTIPQINLKLCIIF